MLVWQDKQRTQQHAWAFTLGFLRLFPSKFGYFFKIHLLKFRPNKAPSFLMKAVLGMSAGAAGAFVGTPTEVALIRMTSDGRLPPDQRRNYKNVFNAVGRIYGEEGLFALWRGCVPTIGRKLCNRNFISTFTSRCHGC